MTEAPGPRPVTGDQVASVATVLNAVRSDGVTTRPEIARVTGLGRNVVTDRVGQLMDAGLLAEGEFGRSTGGRAPRELRFRSEAGVVLVAELGATSFKVGVADLSGKIIRSTGEQGDIGHGPVVVLTRVAELFDGLVAELPFDSRVWGVGVGLPGPVEFDTGRPVSPPIMPGWDGYDVRDHLGRRFDAPVWVDNDVNVMALGELRDGLAQGHQDVIFIKVGSGIGAGLVSRGGLHRGAQGCAGDFGHVAVGGATVACRCGQTGCLEALAGGFALARDGRVLAHSGASPVLSRTLATGGEIDAEAVIWAAQRADPAARELVVNSARHLGEAMAQMVNLFNPSLILIGGGVASAGDLYLREVRQSVIARSLPLATRSLQIIQSQPADQAGLCGAAYMVIDELLSPRGLLTRFGDLSVGAH